MFEALVIEIKLKHNNVDLDEIEYEFLKNLTKEYKFEEKERTSEFIKLKDSLPILACSFKCDSVEIVGVASGLDEFITYIKLILEKGYFNDVEMTSLHLANTFEVEQKTKLINLNYEEEEIERISILVKSKNNKKPVQVKFLVSGDERRYAVINVDSINENVTVENFEQKFYESYTYLKSIMSSYFSTQIGNVIFRNAEEVVEVE